MYIYYNVIIKKIYVYIIIILLIFIRTYTYLDIVFKNSENIIRYLYIKSKIDNQYIITS